MKSNEMKIPYEKPEMSIIYYESAGIFADNGKEHSYDYDLSGLNEDLPNQIGSQLTD